MIFLFPLLIILFASLFSFVLIKKGNSAVFADVGFIFFMILVCYSFFPAIGFLLAANGFGSIIDNRVAEGWNVNDVEYIQCIYLSFIFGYGVTYLFFRRGFRFILGDTSFARAFFFISALILIVIYIFKYAIKYLYDVDTPESYIESYLALRHLPLIVQQINGVFQQILMVALMGSIIFFVISRRSVDVMGIIFLVLFVCFSYIMTKSRTTSAMAFLTFLIVYVLLSPNVSLYRCLIGLVLCVFIFLFVGLIRGESGTGFLAIFQDGEFVSLFINPLDLSLASFEHTAGVQYYFNDFLKWIPSQILSAIGMEKIDYSVWYVSQFYPVYYAQGGGLAFGIISESVLGFGVVEGFIRGCLVALVFAFIANWFFKRPNSCRAILFYIWFCVMSYQVFRDTNFSPFVRMEYSLLPILVIFWLIEGMFSDRREKLKSKGQWEYKV